MKQTWKEPNIETIDIAETAKSENGHGWGQCKENNGIGWGSDPTGMCS